MFRIHALICGGTGCTSSGSAEIQEALHREIAAKGLEDEIKVVQTGCFGLCALGPIMIIYPEGIFYSKVTAEDVPEIVEEHFLKGRPVERLIYKEEENETEEQILNSSLSDTQFYKKQLRVALRNCGVINPENIDEYIAMDGYFALAKVLKEMTPEDVIKTILDSGLRGRGGGGFPTGRKWQFARNSVSDKKYVVCNADEGDPGAFVCGEETALLTSIEGHRGMPRSRPPFPAVKGLWGKPTIINNVETYANIAQIILKAPEWFASMGTEKSKGTKVFALGGKIHNTGLVEIPMGTTLREIVEDIGGGVPNGKKFKAAQTGGPSGGCIPASLIDTPIDYDNLIAIGSMMGSGGLIVMDEDTCMVDLAKFFLEFTVDESCGKCSPCRIGTRRMLEILTKITEGKGTMNDLDELEELAATLKSNSLCALGQTAANPVLSTLKHFRDEYIAHIVDKKCPAGVCKKLMKYSVLKDKCFGCGMCMRSCPADAISKTDYIAPGKKLPAVAIDPQKCIKCGACIASCKFKAIVKE